jgi:hypothetical protein
MTRPRPTISVRGSVLAVAFLLLLCSLALFTPSTSGAASRVQAKSSHAPAVRPLDTPSCPANFTCATIPAQCPSGTTCPTVEVGPTSDLGPDQWVYVNLSNFSSEPGVGDFAQINYCTDTVSLSASPPAICADQGGEGLAQTTYPTQAFADGTSQVSFQVESIDPSSLPLDGAVPGDAASVGKFRCNSTSQCSVDVTDTGPENTGSQTMTAANTAVIPVTFASGSACGNETEDTVNTQSDFGADLLFSLAAQLSCGDSQPTAAFNTAIDGLGAVQSLSNGIVDVAFTDNPEATDQQAILKAGKYALIPVALSANVIAFSAEQRAATHQELFPDNTMKLTPAMAAGLTTGFFAAAPTSDVTACGGGGCVSPPCTKNGNKAATTCSLLNELNFQSGFVFPQAFGGFVRSDTAGSTGELFDWLCKAPNVPVDALGSSVTEPKTGAQVLEAGLDPTGKPLATCPTEEQFPPVRSGLGGYNAYSGPSQQSLKMNAFVTPTIQQPTIWGAFSSMNWADANYFGLSVASLQNAAGAFQAPDAASLDAAVADATTNADGTLSPNYASSDAAAYPMPSITYAVVPTTGVAASQVQLDQNMLNQLLDLTGGSEQSNLPSGFVPLPPSLYQEARSDVATDFNNEGAPSTSAATPPGSSGGSTPSAGAGGSTGSSGSSFGAGSPPSQTVNNGAVGAPAAEPSGSNKVPSSLTPGGSSASGGGGSNGSNGSLGSIALASNSSSTLVPLVLLLALMALAAGVALFFSRGLRQHAFVAGQSLARETKRVTKKVSTGAARGRVWVTGRPGGRRPW